MPKFALKKMETIVGKQQFFELLIDNVSQYEQFEAEIRDNPQYLSEMKTILAYMNLVAELRLRLPKNKFRDITPSKDKVKEYGSMPLIVDFNYWHVNILFQDICFLKYCREENLL
jgi:hypothetical protein